MSAPLSSKLPWELANPLWAQTLNPIINSPLSAASIIENVVLINGTNIIPHKLNRLMQGWFLMDINGIASIYRSLPFNNKTLTLVSNAAVTIGLGVF